MAKNQDNMSEEDIRIRMCALWVIFTRLNASWNHNDPEAARIKHAECLATISAAFHMEAIDSTELDYLYNVLWAQYPVNGRPESVLFPFGNSMRVYDKKWRSRYEAWLAHGGLPSDSEGYPVNNHIAGVDFTASLAMLDNL